MVVQVARSPGNPSTEQRCCVNSLPFGCLFFPDHKVFPQIVTPLNLLGSQNVQSLEPVGIKAIIISGDSATAENFQVSYHSVMKIITPEVTTF